MQHKLLWKIYYENGTTFSNLDGSPWEAPRLGVQVIIYQDINHEDKKVGYSMLSQADYYYYEPERTDWGWWHCSPQGMMLHLQRAKKPLILFGSMIKTQGYTKIEEKALKEMAELKIRWRRGMDKQDSGVRIDG